MAADRAVGIAAQLEGAGLHGQQVAMEELAGEWGSESGEELDGFRCLKSADEASDCAEHAGFRTGGCGAGRGRVGKHAAVAGTSGGRVKDRELAFAAGDGSVDIGDAEPAGDIAAQVAGFEVIGAVDDDVAISGESHGIGGAEAVAHDGDAQSGIKRAEAVCSGFRLGSADVCFREESLAVEIREGHLIVVYDDEVADAGCGEVEEGWAAEAAGAEAEDRSVREFLLGGGPESRQRDLAGKTAESGGAGPRRWRSFRWVWRGHWGQCRGVRLLFFAGRFLGGAAGEFDAVFARCLFDEGLKFRGLGGLGFFHFGGVVESIAIAFDDEARVGRAIEEFLEEGSGELADGGGGFAVREVVHD